MRTPFTDPIIDIIGDIDETQATGAVDDAYKMMAYVKAIYAGGIAGKDIFFGTITTGGSATVWDVEGLAGLGDHFFYNSKWYALMVYTTDQAAPIGEWRAVTDYVSADGEFTSAAFSVVTTAGDQVYIIPSYIYTAILSLGNMSDAATNSNLSDITTTSAHAKLSRLLTDYTNGRAGYLDELSSANIPADIDSIKDYTHHLTAVTDGASSNLAAANVVDGSIIAKLASKTALGAAPEAFDCTTDSLEAISDRMLDTGTNTFNATALTAIEGEVEDGLEGKMLDHLLAVTDGTASTLAAANVADGSIIAKLASKTANGAAPENFNCTTDSLEAIADHVGNTTGVMSDVTQSESTDLAAYVKYMREVSRIKNQARIGLIVPDYANIASDTDNAALYAQLALISVPNYIDQTEVDAGEQDWLVYDLLVVGSDKYAAFTTGNLDDLITMKVPILVCNSPVAEKLKMGTATTDGDSSVDEYIQSIGNRVTMLCFGVVGNATLFSPAATSDRLDMSDPQLTEQLLATNLVGDSNTTTVIGWLPAASGAGTRYTLDDASEIPAGRVFAGCFNNADNLNTAGLNHFKRICRNLALSAIDTSITVNANAAKLNDIDTDLGEPNDGTTDTLHGKIGTDTEMADVSLYDMLKYFLHVTDGAASTLAAANVADGSIVAKIVSKTANGAAPENFNCTTDSLEALSDKIGAFTGDGGTDQNDSVLADLNLINDLVDGLETAVGTSVDTHATTTSLHGVLDKVFDSLLSQGSNTFNATALTAIEGEVEDGLEGENLNYLVKDNDGGAAYPTKVADNSILGIIMTKQSGGDVSDFDSATDSLEAIADAIAGFSAGAGTATVEKQNQGMDGTTNLSGGWDADTDNLHDIAVAVAAIPTTAMRGTDNAALASDVGTSADDHADATLFGWVDKVYDAVITVDDYIDSEVTAIKAKTDYLQNLEDAVYFKTGGTDSATWPTGTAQDPCGDMTDVLTMCAARNTTRIIMTTGTTLIESCEGYTFIGVNKGITIDLGSQDVDGSYFYNCTVTGIQGGTGKMYLHNCNISTLTDFSMDAFNCHFLLSVVLTPRISATYNEIYNSEMMSSIIDFTGSTGAKFVIAECTGACYARNSIDADNTIYLYSSSGFFFESQITNTLGTFAARGNTHFIKGGDGATEVDQTAIGGYSLDGGALATSSVKAQLDLQDTAIAAIPTVTPDAAGVVATLIDTTDKLNLLLAATDGAASTLAAANVADGSIIAKLASKAANGATPEAFNCTTDSLEALSDKIGAFTGDGGTDQGDSIKADLDLINDLVDGVEAKTDLILPGTKFATKTSTSHLTSGDLFTFTGSIGIVSILGRVTTALEAATAQNCKLTITPDALSACDICANKDIGTTALAAGSLITITGTFADALVATTGVGCAVSQASMITATCVTDGHISVVFGTSGSLDGVIVWELFWTPLTPGATCVAA